MEERRISKAVIKRLPRYYRYLGEMLNNGVERISSGELSNKMQVTASQIRQDLNNFGGFGQQGYGYNVQYLYDEIGKILGVNTTHPMIIIGGGNFGHALANYDFSKNGFITKAIFDIRPELAGTSIRGIPVLMMDELEEFVEEEQIEIAVLTLPKSKVQEAADQTGSLRNQGSVEFCTSGSGRSEGCGSGERTSGRQSDAAFLSDHQL